MSMVIGAFLFIAGNVARPFGRIHAAFFALKAANIIYIEVNGTTKEKCVPDLLRL